MTFKQLSGMILDAAIQVHRVLGPGLLEKAYEFALMTELELRGLRVRRQVPVSVVYRGRELPNAYFIDLLVEERVVIEIKVVDKLIDVHKAQLLTYLKCGDYRLGQLLNFAHPPLIDGYVRLANKLDEDA